MKLKKTLLALFAAAVLMAGCGPRQSPSERRAEFEAHRLAEEKADTEALQQKVQKIYGDDLQKSLTGYFNAHGMTAENVKEGLVIPWTASRATQAKIGKYYDGNDTGYMTATGKTDARGCPVFDVLVQPEGIRYVAPTSRTELPVCPKPAAPAPGQP